MQTHPYIHTSIHPCIHPCIHNAYSQSERQLVSKLVRKLARRTDRRTDRRTTSSTKFSLPHVELGLGEGNTVPLGGVLILIVMAVVGRPVNQSSNTQLQRTELNSPLRESAQVVRRLERAGYRDCLCPMPVINAEQIDRWINV